jgi:hexosaminidase
MNLASASLGLSFLTAMMLRADTRVTEPDPCPVPIIPRPSRIEMRTGSFTLDGKTAVIMEPASPRMKELASIFSRQFLGVSGITLRPVPAMKAAKNARFVLFKMIPQDHTLGNEGYRLTVGATRIEARASSENGIFYAMQTIVQLVSGAESAGTSATAKKIFLPALMIEDVPRFAWRGMHLDVSRHFFPKEFVEEYLDILAAHKINVFHWHLTDDQGWRIEIKKYPRLTEVGAWRVDREEKDWRARDRQRPGEKASYGGFYTQDDVREVVDYARQRCIAVLPEIEMPAHSLAALAAYPEYSCTGGPFTVPPGSIWPDTVIFCAGNDRTFEFIENVLNEVIELFPGAYVHIGGDEADKTIWKHCPRCQARIKSEGLKDESELQSYFVKRVGKYIISRGRRLIGWDEILEGGLAPEATVMSWRGVDGGVTAARAGHDVVMSPTSHCYFDYYQAQPEDEGLAIGGYLPAKTVYAFEPVPDSLTPEQAKHVLGGQANLWTEYVPTPTYAEYMLLPRLSALAEALWSPKEIRNWDDFSPRLEKLFGRFDREHWNYAKSVYKVTITPTADTTGKRVVVSLSNEIPRSQIRFTVDGSTMTGKSLPYTGPVPIQETTTLRAAAFDGDKQLSPTVEQKFIAHKANFKRVEYSFPVSPSYPGGGAWGLTDMIRGGVDHHSGRWQGFSRVDCEVTIDLGQIEQISRIMTGCLQNVPAHIFFPDSVRYALSIDGTNFTQLPSVVNTVPQYQDGVMMKDFTAEFTTTATRFVKVLAKNVGVCPPWHQAAGTEAWVFVDEIVVE